MVAWAIIKENHFMGINQLPWGSVRIFLTVAARVSVAVFTAEGVLLVFISWVTVAMQSTARYRAT